MRILITGASRGIGLEFTRQYLAAGHHVLACCRNPATATLLHALNPATTAGAAPGRLDIVALDVVDEASLRTAHEAVSGLVDGVDLLINNAGIFPKGEITLADFDAATMLEALRVNTVAPLAVVKQFLDLLRAGRSPKIINIGSGCGSALMVRTTMPDGGWSYKCSKTALNTVTCLLAHELRPAGIVVISIQPGWVRTDMTCPEADLSPEESVGGMVRVIAGLTPAESGEFFTYRGELHPW